MPALTRKDIEANLSAARVLACQRMAELQATCDHPRCIYWNGFYSSGSWSGEAHMICCECGLEERYKYSASSSNWKGKLPAKKEGELWTHVDGTLDDLCRFRFNP